MRPIATIALSALVIFAASAAPVAAQSVTAYEGARVIVGDGRVIDNATLIVDGTKLSQVGAAVHAPAGAKRVDLRGKTVMPAIVDTHVHLSTTREALLRDLRQRAYWGVSAALSLGLDGFELLDVRGQAMPGTA